MVNITLENNGVYKYIDDVIFLEFPNKENGWYYVVEDLDGKKIMFRCKPYMIREAIINKEF